MIEQAVTLTRPLVASNLYVNGIASEGPAYLRVPFGRDRSMLIVHERA